MDNEASAAFKEEIRKNYTLQLVPPDNHRRNLAERATQTFKSHFKAILAGVADNFPMNLWDTITTDSTHIKSVTPIQRCPNRLSIPIRERSF